MKRKIYILRVEGASLPLLPRHPPLRAVDAIFLLNGSRFCQPVKNPVNGAVAFTHLVRLHSVKKSLATMYLESMGNKRGAISLGLGTDPEFLKVGRQSLEIWSIGEVRRGRPL